MAGEKLTIRQKLLLFGAILAGVTEIVNAAAKAMAESEKTMMPVPAAPTEARAQKDSKLPSVAGESDGRH